MGKDRVFELTDVVRETAFAIHCYFGPGYLEKVYENRWSIGCGNPE
jgi:hypothetical protein